MARRKTLTPPTGTRLPRRSPRKHQDQEPVYTAEAFIVNEHPQPKKPPAMRAKVDVQRRRSASSKKTAEQAPATSKGKANLKTKQENKDNVKGKKKVMFEEESEEEEEEEEEQEEGDEDEAGGADSEEEEEEGEGEEEEEEGEEEDDDDDDDDDEEEEDAAALAAQLKNMGKAGDPKARKRKFELVCCVYFVCYVFCASCVSLLTLCCVCVQRWLTFQQAKVARTQSGRMQAPSAKLNRLRRSLQCSASWSSSRRSSSDNRRN